MKTYFIQLSEQVTITIKAKDEKDALERVYAHIDLLASGVQFIEKTDIIKKKESA